MSFRVIWFYIKRKYVHENSFGRYVGYDYLNILVIYNKLPIFLIKKKMILV